MFPRIASTCSKSVGPMVPVQKNFQSPRDVTTAGRNDIIMVDGINGIKDIPIEGWMVVKNKRCGELMIDNHWMDNFGMSSDEFDKETGSSDGLQPKKADLSCVHALNATSFA
ncbi:hypothetical protein Tco_0996783 [Tanacetum coccineum]